MNESEIPIDIHTLKLQDWLVSRRIVPKNIQAPTKDIRLKIGKALQDMPSNDELIKLLAGKHINYYHVIQIIEILKHTEKDTKSVFGTYGSQRMKDWLEIARLYEKNCIYLAEAAQIYVHNINYEIPNVRKQKAKLEQQIEESLNHAHDLNKPESQLLAEHAALLLQLGVKGENLHEELVEVLGDLPELYEESIKGISKILKAIELYSEFNGQKQCLPILRHLIDNGNTTVYQFVHKEAPLAVIEPPIKLSCNQAKSNTNDNEGSGEIDFGNNEIGGTSSTVSAEIIDYGDFSSIDLPESDGSGTINWGIESAPTDNVEINFDIPIEEYGIVVDGTSMSGGTAKGDQAFTILDSPNYRERFFDEIFELEAFLRMRLFELNLVVGSNNIMLSLMDNITTHGTESISKMLKDVQNILLKSSDEHITHLFQLKHSSKYAGLLALKLQQMTKAVDKLRSTREVMKQRAVQLRDQRQKLDPIVDNLVAEARSLQSCIESDISKRYKNRVVNLLGGV